MPTTDDRGFAKAQTLRQRGDAEGAARLCRKLLGRNPRDARALHLLGSIEAGAGRLAEARSLMVRSLSLPSADLRLFESCATLLLRIGDPDAALDVCSRGLAVEADRAGLLHLTATALLRLGRTAEALATYDRLLAHHPRHAAALEERGTLLAMLGRIEEALCAFRRAAEIEPGRATAHVNMGTAYAALRRPTEAAAAYEQAVTLKRDFVPAWLGRAAALAELGRLAEAEHAFAAAAALQPEMAAAWLGRGSTLAALGRHADALAAFDQATRLRPADAAAWLGRGEALKHLGRADEALVAYERALTQDPSQADAWVGTGDILVRRRRFDEAAAAFDRASAIRADHTGLWLGRGGLALARRNHAVALDVFDRVLRQQPDLAHAWLGRGHALAGLGRNEEALDAYGRAAGLAESLLGRGHVLLALGRHGEALAAFDTAIARAPDLAEALVGSGTVLAAMKRDDEALVRFDAAIARAPDLASAWLARGNVHYQRADHADARAAWDKARALDPALPGLAAGLLRVKMHLCDWTGFAADSAAVLAAVRAGVAVPPFFLLSIDASSADHLDAARLWTTTHVPAPPGPAIRLDPRPAHDRIRLAYLSADFHAHATAWLMAGVFEHHDRAAFETTALSIGPDDGSETRARVARAFDRFVDVASLGDAEIAALVRWLEVDILVDLKGFTRDARPGVLAHRCAPVQVNHLVYPGTMGADFIDYIVADRMLVPDDHRRYYREKVVRLPDSYQATDDRRAIADRTFTRRELGLPDDAIVFCCFNDTYKITPPMFDRWARILHGVPGSVLWLLVDDDAAAANLRREAGARGIAPERLVTAGRLPVAEHLARQRAADLFLDTLPCNAHTTASDALWAGLPVLTCPGETFAGRVAASLLAALRLPELICPTLDAYETTAIALGNDPARLSALRDTLLRHRRTAPLFDTARYTRHLEAAFTAMWERQRADLPPDHIDIASGPEDR